MTPELAELLASQPKHPIPVLETQRFFFQYHREKSGPAHTAYYDYCLRRLSARTEPFSNNEMLALPHEYEARTHDKQTAAPRKALR